MKRFTTSWMRVMLLGLVSLFAFQEAGAATVTYDGITTPLKAQMLQLSVTLSKRVIPPSTRVIS